MVRQETWKGRETFAFALCFECAAEAWELVAASPLGDEEILGIVSFFQMFWFLEHLEPYISFISFKRSPNESFNETWSHSGFMD